MAHHVTANGNVARIACSRSHTTRGLANFGYFEWPRKHCYRWLGNSFRTGSRDLRPRGRYRSWWHHHYRNRRCVFGSRSTIRAEIDNAADLSNIIVDRSGEIIGVSSGASIPGKAVSSSLHVITKGTGNIIVAGVLMPRFPIACSASPLWRSVDPAAAASMCRQALTARFKPVEPEFLRAIQRSTSPSTPSARSR